MRNLEGTNTITVFNVLGVEMSRIVTEKTDLNLDMSALPDGNYLIRVTDMNGSSRTVRVLNLN